MPMLTTLRMRLPVWPFQAPLRTRFAEVAHLVEHGVDLRNDVLAIHVDRTRPGRTQRHVQHSPVLGDVDALSAEHGVDALAQAGLLGEVDQQLERLIRDAILRVVEVDARGLEREPLTAVRVVGKQLSQGDRGERLVVRLQRRPGRTLGQGKNAICHR